jgi:hypothetical protein
MTCSYKKPVRLGIKHLLLHYGRSRINLLTRSCRVIFAKGRGSQVPDSYLRTKRSAERRCSKPSYQPCRSNYRKSAHRSRRCSRYHRVEGRTSARGHCTFRALYNQFSGRERLPEPLF